MKFALEEIHTYLNDTISLVASESLLRTETRRALSSIGHQLTMEGTVSKRYFPSPDALNSIEIDVKDKLNVLFGCPFCDVRPTTATHANIAVYMSILKPGDTILSLDIANGGHLSHGHPHSFAGRIYKIQWYYLDQSGYVDLVELENLVKKYRPKLVISGGSSCPREVNHHLIADIAHKYNAFHLADISHVAGLIAGNVVSNTLDASDFITFGMQKTFLGPRGGIVLAQQRFRTAVESAVFPGIEGAMLLPQILAKWEAATFARTREFCSIQNRIVSFAGSFAEVLLGMGIHVLSGGTDNHMLIVLPDNAMEKVETLNELGVRCNLNPVPFRDEWGIRFGTTSLAQGRITEEEAKVLYSAIGALLLNHRGAEAQLSKVIHSLVALKKNRLRSIESGNFIRTSKQDKRDRLTTETFIQKKQEIKNDYAPLITPPKSIPRQHHMESAIIIPTVGEWETLGPIISYAKAWPKCQVFVVEKHNQMSKPCEQLADNVFLVPLEEASRRIIDLSKLEQFYGFNPELHFGKGWSMFIGLMIAIENKFTYTCYLDADLEDITSYDPLGKLFYGVTNSPKKTAHWVIATPNRRNEVIHSVLNAYNVQHPIVMQRSRALIHFLAGERCIATNLFSEMPWMTNGGIETWLNLYSASTSIGMVQLSNSTRRDGVNSYTKNETMLMYDSRVIGRIVDAGLLDNADDVACAKYSTSWRKNESVSILPLQPEKPVEEYIVVPERCLPSYTSLKENGIIKEGLHQDYCFQEKD